ncbi:hypothetical protein BDN72DRAFT_842310 [Pluteus cervinus]|uniref:Uncharacterized protein n=1 Tax=Pluteus cervinus TaxID=181527 RepID=A0ACD3AS70_9AGAR|nr:hypothetical protein BDN72DRAFT_842310 [Pluteus cervinus]
MVTVAQMAGPLIIGCALNWLLYGAVLIQLYNYHTSTEPGDRLVIRIFVYAIFIVETAVTSLITNTMWNFVIIRWGQPTAFDQLPPSVLPTAGMSALVAASVQVFFAWYIYKLRQNKKGLVGFMVIALLATTSCATGLAMVGKAAALGSGAAQLISLRAFTTVWYSCIAACNILIAVSMTVIMLTTKRSPGHSRSLSNYLLAFSIETGAVLAVVSTIQLTLYLTFPGTFIHLTLMYVLGKLYAVVLLACMNGRHRSANILGPSHFAFLSQGLEGTERTQVADTSSMPSFGPRPSMEISVMLHSDKGDMAKFGQPLAEFDRASSVQSQSTVDV